MRSLRYILFFISIIVGVALGLYYAWQINPGSYTNTTPDRLRADYKADYCLMVAEIYHKDKDITLAMSRLSVLENVPPLGLVQKAILVAKELKYDDRDIQLLGELTQALIAESSTGGGGQP